MNDRTFLDKYRVPAVETEPAAESENHPVHEGIEIETGRKVLIETYPASSVSPSSREQLEAEANAAKKLIHTNIPALYDFGIEDEHLVYVSAYFDGTVAEDWVKKYGAMPVSPVLHIASQVVSALSAAAFHRIIHGNINPRDLLLSPGETAAGQWPFVKVLHLTGGPPRPWANGALESEKLRPYASPEQLEHGTVDFRSEMYSLGATMWFLLTGQPPPVSGKDQPSKSEPSPPTPKGVPSSVRWLLAQMLSPNPETRPGDPLAFSRLLQDCTVHLHGHEMTPRPSPPSKRAPPKSEGDESQWNRKRVLLVVAIPSAMAVIASVVTILGYFRSPPPNKAQKPINAPVAVAAPRATGTPMATLVVAVPRATSTPMAPVVVAAPRATGTPKTPVVVAAPRATGTPKTPVVVAAPRATGTPKTPVVVAAPRATSTPRTPVVVASKSGSSRTLSPKSTPSETTSTASVEGDFVQRASINMVLPPVWPKSLGLFRSPRPPEAAYAPPSVLGAQPNDNSFGKMASATQVEVPTTGHSLARKPNVSSRTKKTPRRPESATAAVPEAEPVPPAEGPTPTPKPTRSGDKPGGKIRDNARAPGRLH